LQQYETDRVKPTTPFNNFELGKVGEAKPKLGRVKPATSINSFLLEVFGEAKSVPIITNATTAKYQTNRVKLANPVNGIYPEGANEAKSSFVLTVANPCCIFRHTQIYATLRTNLAIVTLVGDRVGSDKPIEVRGCHINKYRK
jgi:hypothetical protein